MERINPAFDHALKKIGPELLIESICKKCGASKIVSFADSLTEQPAGSSAAQWEASQVCGKPGRQKTNAA